MSNELVGIVGRLASAYGMDPKRYEQTLRATVFPADGTPEQFAAFCLVAHRYGLDPVLKQIYAFPDRKRGGVIPIVSIDGFIALANKDPDFDGMEFDDTLDQGELIAVTCKVHRKSRAHPVEVTEYMSECVRTTDPWKQYPRRMLRHKATIQALRYAFGFSGIHDEDEAERIIASGTIVDDEPAKPKLTKIKERILEQSVQATPDPVEVERVEQIDDVAVSFTEELAVAQTAADCSRALAAVADHPDYEKFVAQSRQRQNELAKTANKRA